MRHIGGDNASANNPYSVDESRYLDPTAPQAPSGLVYLNTGAAPGYAPKVTMRGVIGAPALVGPTALQANVISVDDERVTVTIANGAVSGYLVKSDSIDTVARAGPGVFLVTHKVPISLSGIVATSYTLGHLTQTEFTSATQSKVYVIDRTGNPTDPATLSVVLQRGGYVSA